MVDWEELLERTQKFFIKAVFYFLLAIVLYAPLCVALTGDSGLFVALAGLWAVVASIAAIGTFGD